MVIQKKETMVTKNAIRYSIAFLSSLEYFPYFSITMKSVTSLESSLFLSNP
jgi:hypothetical protein